MQKHGVPLKKAVFRLLAALVMAAFLAPSSVQAQKLFVTPKERKEVKPWSYAPPVPAPQVAPVAPVYPSPQAAKKPSPVVRPPEQSAPQGQGIPPAVASMVPPAPVCSLEDMKQLGPVKKKLDSLQMVDKSDFSDLQKTISFLEKPSNLDKLVGLYTRCPEIARQNTGYPPAR